jgi:glycosyltransferase involved in cell wall biosynthesis
MRIGLNLSHINPGYNGGVEHVIRACVYFFPLVNPAHRYVIFANENVLKSIDNIEQYETVVVPYALDNLPAITAFLEDAIPLHAIDVWWCPLMVLDPLNISIPSMLVLADLQHEHYPEFFTPQELEWRKKQIALSVKKADVVIVNSEYTKRDVIEYLHLPESKVKVAFHDSSPWFMLNYKLSRRSLISKKYGLPKEFIFYPANTWPHKNHIGLLKALNILKKVYPHLSVVFTGAASNAHNDITTFIEKANLIQKVHYLGHIDRSDMPYIYANAKMLVFPSLFEGFGIPLVEAMRSGCPIVASQVTSIPEVAGDAALYIDPKNPLDIASKISQLLDDKALAQGLVAKGKKLAHKFSYARSAQLIISNLEKMATNHWHGTCAESLVSSAEQPLVSIVTPSYNQGEFIEDTIKSVLEQTYKNIEYIIVDGGSKDNSVQIIQKYASLYPQRIQWISERDRGQTDAINKGLRRARGDIVAWLNSDDIYNLQAVERVVAFFKKNPDTAFVHGQGHHVTKSGEFIENYPSRPCDFQVLHTTCPICQPTTFWRREVLNTVGYLDDGLNFAMDYEYWIRVSKQYPLGFIADHIASTRLYEETKTLGQRHKVHKEILEIVKEHYGSVHANWIYAYAHTYPLVVKNDRKGFVKNVWFSLVLIWYSALAFLRYNHRIPFSSMRLFLGWLTGALFPNKKR